MTANKLVKSVRSLGIAAVAALSLGGQLSAANTVANGAASLKIGVVNFKSVVEESKAGKEEQVNFDGLKKQMEAVLKEKEEKLEEIAAKFNDPDYLDSLSSEAENELKHKFRMMTQELSQIQNQYYQTLNQANMKILQELNDLVAKAAKKVAKEENYDLILNDDGCFFSSDAIDITKNITRVMDQAPLKSKTEAKK